MQDSHKHDEESDNDNYMRVFDLVIDGSDISQFVGSWGSCEERRTSWTLHTELMQNAMTSAILRPLIDKTVLVHYRLRAKGEKNAPKMGPWRAGKADISWRLTKTGNEELILYGTGPLNRLEQPMKAERLPLNVTVTRETTLEGKVVQREQGKGTITIVEESNEQKAIREAFLQMEDDSEVRAITDPNFLLFLVFTPKAGPGGVLVLWDDYTCERRIIP